MSKKEKTKVKKPLKKKWWFWFIVVIIVIGIGGNLGKKPQPKEEPQTEAVTEVTTEAVTEVVTEPATEPAALSEKEQIEKIIRDIITDNCTLTDIDSITINDDAGTDAEGDYIALVNLTWNQKNKGETSKEVLTLYSDDIAATLADQNSSVNEIAIFWAVPYLNSDAKCAYEREGDGFKQMDMALGEAFN